MNVEHYDDFGAPVMEKNEIELLAVDGYAAYGDSVGWKNYAGLPMPSWNDLPEKIRDAWRAHTRTVIENVAKLRIRAFQDDLTLSWEERFRLLEQHHERETCILTSRLMGSKPKV